MLSLSKASRVKLEISRSTFVDYDSFVHTFVRAANLTIEGFDQSSFTYLFANGWECWLNQNGNIVMISPILSGERGREAHSLLEALKQINVRVGENCHAQIVNERFPDVGLWIHSICKARAEVISGLFLVLFIVTKTVEIQLREVPYWYWTLSLQILSHFSFLLVVLSLSKGISLRRSVQPTASEIVPTNSQETVHEPNATMLEDGRPATSLYPDIGVLELAREIKLPLENIVAYVRFYQGATDKQSQHWKDLAEIMEQAIQVQELMNRVEVNSTQKPRLLETVTDSSHLFRRTLRTMELIPLTVRGVDSLGEAFEAPSYTLNLSLRGACLLLPGKMTLVGQKVHLENHRFTTEASVRWVIEGKSGNMVFAGVQFARPIPSLELPVSAACLGEPLSRAVNFSS